MKTQIMRVPDNGFALSHDLRPKLVAIDDLKPLGEATRRHSPHQIKKLRRGIREFGQVAPILLDEKNRVIDGMALVDAMKAEGFRQVQAVAITGLSEAKVRALRLMLNRLSEDSRWDTAALRMEFAGILHLENDIEIEVSGFETAEIDAITLDDGSGEEDEFVPAADGRPPVAQGGDLWYLGEHRILCADARDPRSYDDLLAGERAQMVFTDPPYNVAIEGNVSGLGATKHGNFIAGSGELTDDEFAFFLNKSLGLAARHSADGALHFCCMDWRGIEVLLAATKGTYSELKNVCVWNKTNAGMGALYRSQHELVFVFKVGKAAHINNVALGKYGRNRSNVWTYAGQTSLKGAKNKLGIHPTVKPVAMIADAIRDCSNRGGIILDLFGGAGSTCIAAEKTGRRARLIELDPKYVDVTIRRWQQLTGKDAVHAQSGRTFDQLAAEREASHVAG